jgi:membrane protein implicated in regulation of membrane protease activity
MAPKLRLHLMALGLVGILSLTGCFYVHADFEVNDEQELDIQIDGAIHEDFATADTARAVVEADFPGDGLDRANFAEGPWNGYRFTKNNANPFSWSVSQTDGDFLRFSREGEYVRFEGRYSLTGELAAEAQELLDVRFTLNHMGKVISTNGNKTSPTKVQWEGEWGSVMNMEAVIDPNPAPVGQDATPEALPETEPGAELPQEEPEGAPEFDPAEDASGTEPDPEPKAEATAVAPMEVNIDLAGIATKAISPEGGEIAVDGVLYPARSIQSVIEAGAQVKIVAFDNGVVIVEPADPSLSLPLIIGISVGTVGITAAVVMTLLLGRRRARVRAEPAKTAVT